MAPAPDLLAQYGTAVVFAWAFAVQAGMPAPAVPNCAEPREGTSARMALRLSSRGYKNLHPLSGGLEGWRRAGFAVEPILGVVPPHLDVVSPHCSPAQVRGSDGEGNPA